MARALKKLNARQVATLNREGRHSDGGGLYLVVGPGASRRWAFLFRWRGKLKEMGLGSLASVSLADAREKASEARRTLANGRNPIEDRRAQAGSAGRGDDLRRFRGRLDEGSGARLSQ